MGTCIPSRFDFVESFQGCTISVGAFLPCCRYRLGISPFSVARSFSSFILCKDEMLRSVRLEPSRKERLPKGVGSRPELYLKINNCKAKIMT